MQIWKNSFGRLKRVIQEKDIFPIKDQMQQAEKTEPSTESSQLTEEKNELFYNENKTGEFCWLPTHMQ